jgi:hypothetical protein
MYFTCRPMYMYDNIPLSFLILRNISDCCRQNQNTNSLVFSNFLSEKVVPFVRHCRKVLCSRTGQRWHNAAHSLCMLGNKGYKHTIKMCNTYCFPTANIVRQTRNNITVYLQCRSGYIFEISAHLPSDREPLVSCDKLLCGRGRT